MNKGDLTAKIASDAKITRSQASDALNSFIDNVTKTLKGGKKVTIVGFGTFATSRRKARMGRNPQTGKPIKIAARKVARFIPGKQLKETVNR
ncbi:MAG: HU family DNA-binding protein [Acidobacteria bacterium]|nr:HU family DNA-binding protein [Acidobacteriota bacterium]